MDITLPVKSTLSTSEQNTIDVSPSPSESLSESVSIQDTKSQDDSSILSSSSIENTFLTSDKYDKLKILLSELNNTYEVFNSNVNKLRLYYNLEQQETFLNKTENSLYPNLLDPNFNKKISEKKEFNDTKYDEQIKNINDEGDNICFGEFELSPHQLFIRNFLSFLTPYNSLLLYHGLGTGKTCSAISVCEEMRDYINQLGINKKIIIVASPNVQDNFKRQLFDERKLKKINGLWNLSGCTGNKFIKEINPMNMKGVSREKIIKQVKKLINSSYIFMGYIEFSNYISKIKDKYYIHDNNDLNIKNKINAIKKEFSNRLIVIDEVHNIRINKDNTNKKVAQNLLDIVKYTDSLKLLLLSATPMFNDYKEIVWLLNLMNINDKRPFIDIRDIFDKDGHFVINNGREVGKELLIQKMRGYVSYVRGENPYSFPYRIYPSDFDKSLTLKDSNTTYPSIQLNNVQIVQGIERIDIFKNNIGNYQKIGYDYAIRNIVNNIPSENDFDKGIGWQQIDVPLQCLNFVYPNSFIDSLMSSELRLEDTSLSTERSDINPNSREKNDVDSRTFVGKKGLSDVMTYNKNKSGYDYKPDVLEKHGRFFSHELIQNYSMKLYNLINIIKKSKGIVIIYSQYIDGGCVPIALALEEMGITRYKNKSLFVKEPSEKLDAISMKPKSQVNKETFNPARYIMITGDKRLSPNNDAEIKAVTSKENTNGEIVKVVIISKAGSEGIDFENIRQVHILEPWYNMSRIEQIIGRGVRFCSHKNLPIEERNTEIYLYGTIDQSDVEYIDLYVYRIAEQKAIQIGEISRILKEYAIDCYLNKGLTNLTVDNISQSINLLLSSGYRINYNVGDKPFTQICDYMDSCTYTCKPDINIDENNINLDTYNETFIQLNVEKIINKIKELFKEYYILDKSELIRHLNKFRNYPIIQINSALEILVNDENEFVFDTLNRNGHIINIGNYYIFQPVEINYKHISNYSRIKPIDYKEHKNIFDISEDIKETVLYIKPSKFINNKKVDKIINNFKLLFNYTQDVSDIKRGNNDWYIHCSYTISILSDIIDIQMLKQFVIEHIFDELKFKNKIILIEYLLTYQGDDDILLRIKDYINKNHKIVNDKNNESYLLCDNQKLLLYINNNNKLIKARPLDYDDYTPIIVKRKLHDSNINNIVGFMMGVSNSNDISFKTKNMKLKRNNGARCYQAGKKNIIKLLNSIYNENKYTSLNSKKRKPVQLCSETEFLLRYYNSIKKNNKAWFFSYEDAILNNIEKKTL